MKRLQSTETEQYSLEVCQCECGFHTGIDATYLDQVEDLNMICPSCKRIWNTSEVFNEDGGEGECDDVCLQHSLDCDGNCDHLGHLNMCLKETD
jgi:hypothetical protein